jgi:hypothetical protein
MAYMREWVDATRHTQNVRGDIFEIRYDNLRQAQSARCVWFRLDERSNHWRSIWKEDPIATAMPEERRKKTSEGAAYAWTPSPSDCGCDELQLCTHDICLDPFEHLSPFLPGLPNRATVSRWTFQVTRESERRRHQVAPGHAVVQIGPFTSDFGILQIRRQRL